MKQRTLATALTVLLLVVLAPLAFARSHPVQASDLAGQSLASTYAGAQPRIATPLPTLLGTWTNVNFATRSIVRIDVKPTGGTDVTVHAFGACSTTACDWGSVTGTSYATDVNSPHAVALSAQYTFSFAQVILTGILENTTIGPYLNVQEFTKFTDGSGRSNYYTIERFAKVIDHVRYASGPAIPHPHVEGAGMVLGNRLFDISGSSADCTDTGKGQTNNLVDIYDPATNSFSPGAPVHIGRDANPLAAVASTPSGPRGYLIGGNTACGGSIERTVEEYNPLTNNWTPLPSSSDLPAALTSYHHCGAALGSKIYYFQQSGIGVFDATTKTWKVLPAPATLTPSYYCRASVVDPNLIMITGASDGNGGADSQRILYFTPSTGAINAVPGATVPLAEHGMGYLSTYGQAMVAGDDFVGEKAVQSIGAGSFVTNVNPLPMTWDDGASGVLYTPSGPHLYLAGGLGGGSNTPHIIIATPNF